MEDMLQGLSNFRSSSYAPWLQQNGIEEPEENAFRGWILFFRFIYVGVFQDLFVSL